MSGEKSSLIHIFPLLARSVDDERIKNASVESVVLDRASGEMELHLGFGAVSVSRAETAKTGEALAKAYGLKKARIVPHMEWCRAYAEGLRDELAFIIPASNGFFAGADWNISESDIKITLRYGTSSMTDGVCSELAKLIFAETGRRISVSAASCGDEETRRAGEELMRAREEMLRTEEADARKADTAAPAKEKKTVSGPVREKPQHRAAKAIKPTDSDDIIFGTPREEPVTPISEISMESGRVTVCGDVFFTESRAIPAKKLVVVTFDITDYTGSIRAVKLCDEESGRELADRIKKGMYLRVSGTAGFSSFEKDTIITPLSIMKAKREKKIDSAEEKRVELHLHTNMSAMDGMTPAAEYIKRAAEWGHDAIAITDHGVVQAFPEAMSAAKKTGVKVIYGVEGYLVNDLRMASAVDGPADVPLGSQIVCFDLETTGLSAERDTVIEIAAVIVEGGEMKESFHTYVDPCRPIPAEITRLTGISARDVAGAPQLEEAVKAFLDFAGDRPLSAHNASFDMGFLRAACRRYGITREFTSIDTLEMSRVMLPELKKHRLNDVAAAVGADSFEHHRADEDTGALAQILIFLLKRLEKEKDVRSTGGINAALTEMRGGEGLKRNHILLLAKNLTGIRELYGLVSSSHLKHFSHKRPTIPASELAKNRSGLIVCSACEAGELFTAVAAGRPMSELLRIASFYDVLEIQPIGNNEFMIANGRADSVETLKNFNRKIIDIADRLKKPVIATGDVHFINARDEIFRRILMAGQGFEDADRQAPLYYRTTDEMLAEFEYLGDRAYEVVVKNTRMIADMCERIDPIPSSEKPFAPELPGSAEELTELTYGKAKRLYGDPLPDIVRERIEKELMPITKYGFDVMYMIAQKLVARSLECGYLVGSRGSVGSSLVAFMSGITEVNALPPHYRCSECKYSEFHGGEGFGCGADMKDKTCPKCGAVMEKDGFDIPFATFLGFDADKAPDIDLNFSGEYQSKAHKHTIELFGEENVFRAGTIGTVAEKTAFGYVKKYADERGLNWSKAEINRLVQGCTGVKRTTSQHPGGLIVVPKTHNILEFTPIQHPADDVGSETITTHFDYHSIDKLLLKLDLLGHDSPTTIRHLEDMTGLNAQEIPLDDSDTMSIFTSTKALGFENDPILGKIGAAGIPEFGTKFVRQMLEDTQPTTFDELVRISGLSHGTMVWVGNAQDIVRSGTATLREIICARDDIMLYLISKEMEPKKSFFIMESVRKGRGLRPEWEEDMRAHSVPEWYIESCKKIQYMFPKAHAVAYVMMAFRIAWFKVHRPLEFYCAWFSNRVFSFETESALRGCDCVKDRMRRINENPASTKTEQEIAITLEMCYEFFVRGFTFECVDVYRSDATRFKVGEGSLIPPLTAIEGLGEGAAQSICAEREKGEFSSEEDLLMRCSRVSRAIVGRLRDAGALGALPESEQTSLF